MEMDSTPPPGRKEQALSRLLLLGGLLLVAGALAIYHKSGGFQPGPQTGPQSASQSPLELSAPVVPAIRGKAAAEFLAVPRLLLFQCFDIILFQLR